MCVCDDRAHLARTRRARGCLGHKRRYEEKKTRAESLSVGGRAIEINFIAHIRIKMVSNAAISVEINRGVSFQRCFIVVMWKQFPIGCWYDVITTGNFTKY